MNVLQTLSVMLNTAKDWGYVCEGMSLKRLALPAREARKTPRFFTAEEARRIIAAAREPYATIYAVAAMTGMRAGKLLGLRLTDIDFERRLILVQRSLWHGKLQSEKKRDECESSSSSRRSGTPLDELHPNLATQPGGVVSGTRSRSL